MTPYTRLSPPAIRKSTAVYTAVFRAWTTRVAMRLSDSATGRGFLHKRAAAALGAGEHHLIGGMTRGHLTASESCRPGMCLPARGFSPRDLHGFFMHGCYAHLSFYSRVVKNCRAPGCTSWTPFPANRPDNKRPRHHPNHHSRPVKLPGARSVPPLLDALAPLGRPRLFSPPLPPQFHDLFITYSTAPDILQTQQSAGALAQRGSDRSGGIAPRRESAHRDSDRRNGCGSGSHSYLGCWYRCLGLPASEARSPPCRFRAPSRRSTVSKGRSSSPLLTVSIRSRWLQTPRSWSIPKPSRFVTCSSTSAVRRPFGWSRAATSSSRPASIRPRRPAWHRQCSRLSRRPCLRFHSSASSLERSRSPG